MATVRRPTNLLFELYASYAGEPESRREVYGYWAFVAGSLVAFAGVLVYLLGPTTPPDVDYGVRQFAFTLAAIGLPTSLFGILLLLPVHRRGVYAAAGGSALALLGVIGFLVVYPHNWIVGTPDYSGIVITVYTAGLATIVAVAALVPVATGERSLLVDAEYEREGEYPGVIVGETDRGGLFSVYRSGGEWTWRLLEQSAIAGSAEEYLSKLETEEAIDRVKQKVSEAGLMEIRSAAFRLYEATEGQWRWLLMRADGSVVAEGDAAFADRGSAATAVNELKELGPDAELLEIDGAAVDCYRENGDWQWRLVDQDRQPLAHGSGRHDSQEAAAEAAAAVREQATDAAVLAIEAFGVELFEEDDVWRWRLVDTDETEVATASVGFDSRRDAEAAVYETLDALGNAPVLDRGQPTYEVTPTGNGWNWTLVGGDERILATGASALGDPDASGDTARRVAASAEDADIVHIEDADFEYFRGEGGWRWRLVTADRRIIATAASGVDSQETAAEAIQRVKHQSAEAELIEYEDAAFQVYESDGEWRWRLIDEDGNVMTDSGAEHESKDEAMGSMMTVKKNAPDAELLEIETAAFELFERDGRWNWRLVDDAGETTAQGGQWHDSRSAAKEAMAQLTERAADSRARAMSDAVFQLFADADDDWRWRYVAPDGSVLAETARTYGTRDEAVSAIDERVRGAAASAGPVVIESVAIQVDGRGDDWTWRLLDTDRSELARSADAIASRDDTLDAVDELRNEASNVAVFERKESAFLLSRGDGAWRWKLVGNRGTLATSPDAHADREAAERQIDRVTAVFPDAGTLDYEDAAFELYREEDRWFWWLVDEDERVIADDTVGYETRDAAVTAVAAVREEVGDASVLEIDSAAFELHEDGGDWRWRLVDENGEVLVRGTSTHSTRREAREAMESVKTVAPASTAQIAE